MKEKIKNIVSKVREAVKKFRIMLAEDLIDEAVSNAKKLCRAEMQAKSNKATEELLKTIFCNCPPEHIILFAKERYPVNMNDGLKAFYENPTAPHICVMGKSGLPRAAFPEEYIDVHIINPKFFSFGEMAENYVRDVVNFWDYRQITFFEYVKVSE